MCVGSSIMTTLSSFLLLACMGIFATVEKKLLFHKLKYKMIVLDQA